MNLYRVLTSGEFGRLLYHGKLSVNTDMMPYMTPNKLLITNIFRQSVLESIGEPNNNLIKIPLDLWYIYAGKMTCPHMSQYRGLRISSSSGIYKVRFNIPKEKVFLIDNRKLHHFISKYKGNSTINREDIQHDWKKVLNSPIPESRNISNPDVQVKGFVWELQSDWIAKVDHYPQLHNTKFYHAK